MRKLIVLLWMLASLAGARDAQSESRACPMLLPTPGERYVVAISDLHFGLGRQGGAWNPTEDFRWSSALKGFLDRTSACGRQTVDLVIAGDAMELWQPPPEVKCAGANADTACTPSELLLLVKMVIKAHGSDFEALGSFADEGSNRVFFVPGNHDAGILLDSLWSEVQAAASSKTGRVLRCGGAAPRPCAPNGLWLSENGLVAIEHGHQIGSDVNAFSKWPEVLVDVEGQKYLERPWGEYFVQKLFNKEEAEYSIIDNLSPETAGARYRMADRGLWESIYDVARFLRFNVFETSLSQKLQTFGTPGGPSDVDVSQARARGYKLVSSALLPDDPLLKELNGNSPEALALRTELTRMIKNESSVEELSLLCSQIAIRSGGADTCGATFGAVFQQLLVPKQRVFAKHLNSRMKEPGAGGLRLFVYAHTHTLEEGWWVKTDKRPVQVFNTGAFQRVVSEPGFLRRAKAKGLAPAAALSKLTVESLAPCYTAVVVAMDPDTQLPNGRTVRWRMEEGGAGAFVAATDASCE